ncbi:MAG: tetratricopeptide repeat protein [bacterium]|nr:tetratricopeptide repeat protein [bacterium]
MTGERHEHEQENQLDQISARFQREQAQARKQTLWLTMAPIVVGLLVVGSAWVGVSGARNEQKRVVAKLEKAEVELREVGRRREGMLADIQGLQEMRAGLEKEIADQQALFEHFEKKLSAEERQEAQFVAQGLDAVRQEDYPQAIDTLKRALALDPDNSAALNNAGYAYYKNGQFEEAVETLRQATRIDPEFAEAFFNLGFAYWKIDQRDRAVEAFERAFKLDPGYEERARAEPDYKPIWSYQIRRSRETSTRGGEEADLIAQAQQAARDRNYPEAILAYGKALSINPESPELMGRLGNAYYLDGQHKMAAEILMRSVDKHPDYAEGHYYLGLTLWELGDRDRAMDEFKTAFEIEPAWESRARRDPRYQRIFRSRAK